MIIGKNGAGKSSLLQIISSIFGYNPRKSLETIPYYGAQNPKPSSGVFKVNLTPRELEEFILDKGLRLPLPDPANQYEYKRGLATWVHIKKNTEMLETCFSLYAYVLNPDNDALAGPDNKCFLNLPYISTVSGTVIGRSNQERALIEMGYSDPPKLAADVLKQLYRSKCMLLTAQRPNPYKSNIGTSQEISHDGTNLPEVILTLKTKNSHLYDKYLRAVQEVLPEIKHLTSTPLGEGKNECGIFVWYHDTATERDDLAFSLHECGTGVGQVLTILYAAICSKFPKLIAIDEPNSFLHPGAARRLIQVLKRYEQHQYILATHSPELIKAAQPSYIHLISSKEGAAHINSLPASSIESNSAILDEVGLDLQDVFAADNVVWVEGPTEADIFPILYDTLSKKRTSGVSFIALRNTGDLDQKDRTKAQAIWRIYKRLTESNLLIPRTISFSLDREDRSKNDLNEITREAANAGVLLKVLPRKMLENYFIDAEALSAVLSNDEQKIEKATVENWISTHGEDKGYFQKGRVPSLDTPKWLEDIDGAKFLKDMFGDLTNQMQRFDKRKHGKKIVDWLIKNNPSFLEELKHYLSELVPIES